MYVIYKTEIPYMNNNILQQYCRLYMAIIVYVYKIQLVYR